MRRAPLTAYIVKIATGQIEDTVTPAHKAHHSRGGKKLGASTAQRLLSSQIAILQKVGIAGHPRPLPDPGLNWTRRQLGPAVEASSQCETPPTRGDG